MRAICAASESGAFWALHRTTAALAISTAGNIQRFIAPPYLTFERVDPWNCTILDERFWTKNDSSINETTKSPHGSCSPHGKDHLIIRAEQLQ